MIERALAAVAGRGLVVGMVLAALTVVATWDRSRINRATELGERRAEAKTEKANVEVRKKLDGAAARSRDGRVRGERDPHTVD